MAKNDSYISAKEAKNDEFYTQLSDIAKEVQAYLEYDPDVFKNKTILLPCDDPEWSNFTRYFAQNFEVFGLKKLISTSFAVESKKFRNYQPSIFELDSLQFDPTIDQTNGKIFTLERDVNKSGNVDLDDLEWKYLDGDGDFRSNEVKSLRDEADIIITNPPFSQYVAFVQWLLESKKKFLIIGHKSSVTYAEIFPHIKNNILWSGTTSWSGGMWFESKNPDNYDKIIDGVMMKNVPATWFTNIEHGRRHEALSLMTMSDNLKYSKHKSLIETGYVKYDNYDAIEVPFVDSIPSDYDGLMGVPPTFLEKYNPEQFEIVASTQTGCHPDSMVLQSYKDYYGYKQNGKPTGRTGSTCGHNPMLLKNDGIHDYYMNKDGRIVQSGNARLLIRKRGVNS